jgi:hypothetical protein
MKKERGRKAKAVLKKIVKNAEPKQASEERLSRRLGPDEPPGDRGACEKESSSQGSE